VIEETMTYQVSPQRRDPARAPVSPGRTDDDDASDAGTADVADRSFGAVPDAASERAVDTLLRCLVRLTLHFGRPVAASDVRAIVPISDDGMTTILFQRAADRLGYVTRAEPLDAQALAAMPAPFVLVGRAGRPSLVVLERHGGNLAAWDPVSERNAQLGVGEALERAAEALLMRPANDTATRANWRGMIAAKIRSVVWEIVLASLIINLFALASPLFLMTVYNKVIGQRALDTFTVLIIGMVTLYAFDVLLRAIRGYVSSYTGARLDALVGSEVVHHLVHLPFRQFETTPTGVMSERLRQLDVIRAFFTGQMPVTLVDMAFVFVFVGVLFFIAPVLGWLVLGSLPVFFVLSMAFHRRHKALVEQNFLAMAAKSSTLNETLNNALTIKSLGLESEVEKRWSQRLALSAWTGFHSNNQTSIVGIVGTLLQQLVGLAVIFIGVHLILASEMTIGALIAANILATRAVAPVRQVVSAWTQLQEVRAAFARLDGIMDEPTESAPGETSPVPPLEGRLTFQHVTFRFDPDLPPALDDVSFDVPRGTTLGLIGPSGSGKSTLVRLIQRLYQPDSGRILIDETDVGHVSPATLRRQIGCVPQDNQLFAGTVRDNIAFGLPVKDPARIVAVARFVGAHGFIQRLPKGYDTMLGERGTGLSAGQRQLICIARALIRNPRVIILDEATSALDMASEDLLMRNLKRAARDRTIVMISHRLSTLAICDQVGVLIDGRLERIGTPREVIPYARRRMAEERRGDEPTAAVSGATDGAEAP
jgi:HlyB family type I secretion system ABC transporter